MILFVDTTAKIVKLAVLSREAGENGVLNKIHEFEGGRELDSLILVKIDEVLEKAGSTFKDLTGIIAHIGPGSFTGLRIGLSIVNALGFGLNIPVVGMANEKDSEAMIRKGILKIKDKTKFKKPLVAKYGSEPNITKPKGK